MNKQLPSWTIFYFDTNACSGNVGSLTEWKNMLLSAVKYEPQPLVPCAAKLAKVLLDVASCYSPHTGKKGLNKNGSWTGIGTGIEHIGGEPFRTWLLRHNMDPTTIEDFSSVAEPDFDAPPDNENDHE